MGRGIRAFGVGVAMMAATSAQAQAQAQDASSADTQPPASAHERNVAERHEERDRRWHATVFAMEEGEARLPAIPGKLVTFSLPLRRAYLVSAAVDRVVVPRFSIPLGFAKLRGNSLEIEAQALQHFGLERDTELSTAAVIRSGQFGVLGRTSANVAWGNGFSYALTAPTFERGPSGQIGVDTEHLQYHMSFEAEATSGAAPRLHYVFRLHHRSGIYGVISPARTGSNYLGFGLRFDLGGRR